MLNIDRMKLTDISPVLKIERFCFGEGWTATPFTKELERNDCAYFVARLGNEIVGYSGCWQILEELHVTIMAVLPSCRRKKIGQKLLIALLREGISNGAKWATLEVKASNIEAQRLYQKFGFAVKGRRKQYYHQDGEDALIMWTEDIDDNYIKLLESIELELVKV